MHLSRPARVALRLFVAVGLAFVYLPLLVVVIESFNPARVSSWPPDGFTADWWGRAWDNPGARAAVWTSVKAALGATVIALLLGTSLSFAVQRHRFFGRDTLSLLVVLPIALPGIITGIALRSAISLMNVPFSLWTIVIGHATFCVVVVYNNVLARLRRSSPSLVEASMDLGASSFETFRYIVLPNIATALLAGGMLAFALSSAGAIAQAAMASGEVRKIDEAAGKITLKHGPIKNLDMGSMTMVFRVKDPALLKQVKVGDKVKFEADRVDGQITVTNMQKAR